LNDAFPVRFFSAIAIGLLLVGCHQRKPVSKQDAELARAMGAELKQIRLENPGMREVCIRAVQANKLGALELLDNPDCFDMLSPQRWSGLWDTGWEWTNFCPDPAKQCGSSSEHGDVWLTFAKDSYHGPHLADGVYRIEFIGRRTRVPGHFGHLNQYDHLMVVDRIISIERIPGEKYTKRF
jgi:hypothetical protein